MDTKPFWASKTIGGSFAIILGLLLPMLGVTASPTEVSHWADSFLQIVDDAITVGGIFMTIYGRFKAVKPVSLTGAKAIIGFGVIVGGFCLWSWGYAAHAADLPSKAPVPAAQATPLCTPTSCTVFYAGTFMGGMGDNLNILGNGVNGSLNSGGMLPGADIGAQYYDGKFLFGVEADAGYQFNSNTTVNGVGGDQSGFFGIIQVKAGVGLGLLPSQQPLSVNLPLPIVTPYVAAGNMFQAHGGSGVVGGAGIEFQLPASNSLFLDAEYLNGGGPNTSGSTVAKNNNIFLVKLHKAISF